jgi:GNAT superfamily N-acetyltransferase
MVEFRIRWCSDPGRAQEIADFFARNVSDDTYYISHGELQGPRALSSTQWRQPLSKILYEEVRPRLADTEKEGVPGQDSKPILVAETDDGILAVSFVTFDSQFVPHAVIEDLVVDSGWRNTGIGKAVMDWIASEARARDIHRLMLESGLKNERAHEFFEREGFVTCSKVMMREL